MSVFSNAKLAVKLWQFKTPQLFTIAKIGYKSKNFIVPVPALLFLKVEQIWHCKYGNCRHHSWPESNRETDCANTASNFAFKKLLDQILPFFYFKAILYIKMELLIVFRKHKTLSSEKFTFIASPFSVSNANEIFAIFYSQICYFTSFANFFMVKFADLKVSRNFFLQSNSSIKKFRELFNGQIRCFQASFLIAKFANF
jgi:hypothetical protein